MVVVLVILVTVHDPPGIAIANLLRRTNTQYCVKSRNRGRRLTSFVHVLDIVAGTLKEQRDIGRWCLPPQTSRRTAWISCDNNQENHHKPHRTILFDAIDLDAEFKQQGSNSLRSMLSFLSWTAASTHRSPQPVLSNKASLRQYMSNVELVLVRIVANRLASVKCRRFHPINPRAANCGSLASAHHMSLINVKMISNMWACSTDNIEMGTRDT